MSDSIPLSFLLHIGAAAALLLWSIRLVRTGIERAFAHGIRDLFRHSGRWRLLAAATGGGAAVLLQSSTAVALLVASFLRNGTLAAATGLSMLLGADLGSALVAGMLALRPDWIGPVFLLAGASMFLSGRRRRVRQVGRALVGLALVFVSLDLVAEAAASLPGPAIAGVSAYLSRDLASAFALAAVLAWLSHSSIAAVLLVATLAQAGTLTGLAPLAMVLGANLGGAFTPFILTLRSPPEVRRVTLANLAVRGGGAILALWLLGTGALPLTMLGDAAAAPALALHLAFNGVLLCLALPAAPLLLRAAALALPDPESAAGAEFGALDPAALSDPVRAIGCARREILRMGEDVEAMLRAVVPLYAAWDDQAAEDILAREERVDRMHFHTKLYLARLVREGGHDDAARTASDLAALASQI